MNDKYTILGNGEFYISDFDAKSGGGAPRLHRTFEEARQALIPQVKSLLEQSRQLPSQEKISEVVIEAQLHPKYIAKSHHPQKFKNVNGLNFRGSRSIQLSQDEADNFGQTSRLIYFSSSEKNLEKLLKNLESNQEAEFQTDCIKITSLKLSRQDALILDHEDKSYFPAEIVLFNWSDSLKDEAFDAIRLQLKECGIESPNLRFRGQPGQPIYIACLVNGTALNALRRSNYTRVARPMPKLRTFNTSHLTQLKELTFVDHHETEANLPMSWIAVVDGGCLDKFHQDFSSLIECFDLVDTPADDERLLSHGTGVASAALFGAVSDPKLEYPIHGVKSYRVLPESLDFITFDLADHLRNEVVPNLVEPKIVNLSLGPNYAIDDDVAPTHLTITIDELAYEHDVIFVVAVGNSGDKDKPHNRIQPPSDAVNSIGVGAFSRSNNVISEAGYSCSGPGRIGGVERPSLYDFGGREFDKNRKMLRTDQAPFYVLNSKDEIVEESGTSFAAPLISKKLMDISLRTEGELSSQALKTVLINSAVHSTPHSELRAVPDSVEEILACDSNKVRILYQGTMVPKKYWQFPFNIPDSNGLSGTVELSWTFCICPETSGQSTDQYTLGGIEVQLRPHSMKHKFTLKPEDGGQTQTRLLDLSIEENREIAEQLILAGWKRSSTPNSGGPRYLNEHELSNEFMKWETVVHGSTRCYARSLHEPFLSVRVHSRGEWDLPSSVAPQMKYAAILTVVNKGYKGDLYQDVKNQFVELRPLSVLSRQEILKRLTT